MASALGGPAANLLVLLKVILLATLVVSAVAVGNVPGLKWSALEVWEGSASGDAWTRSLEYLDFRSYVLGALSDVGCTSIYNTRLEIHSHSAPVFLLLISLCLVACV